ncbi:monocarboxylate transporter 12-like isoform X1 [Euwallacea similis]|uniref:monocarboxylate transporter 12-like isoform X1 n=1 Tax=Euwallacea similis TaxID=1736056 RepID=UPI00344D28E3
MAQSVDTNASPAKRENDINEISESCLLVSEKSSSHSLCNGAVVGDGVGKNAGRNGKSNKKNNLELYLNEKNAKVKPKIKVNPLFDSGESERLLNPSLIMPSAEEKPVLHVQFNHKDSDNSIKKEPPPPSLPSSDESSSSSSSSSSSESLEIAEARPPDGGWGWVVVAASFMVNLIADGITFSFGVIFVEFLNYFGENRGTTAWVGGLFMAMPLLSGPIASFLTDRYGCRKVTIFGALLASIGFIISSQANSMVVLCITFGVLAGFGLSLCYVASVVIVAYYFDKKRSSATGLAVCGSGIGTFIFAPLIQALLQEYGWRGTTLILAGLFLNMVVCGCLMRDLPWTSEKLKNLAKERKKNRHMKRKNRLMSTDSFSISTGTCTASVLQPIVENNEENEFDLQNHRLCNSVVHLPTYIRDGEKIPAEVLELLASNKNMYNILLANYPNLLVPSRSFSDSGRLNDAGSSVKHANTTTQLSPPTAVSPKDETWWVKRSPTSPTSPTHKAPLRKLPGAAFLKDLRIHRLSVTYRGAMLNLKRYRLRASSCPDIYRNSMTTIAREKVQWFAGLWDFWDLLVDMFDFSHFADPKYLVFALSNFLLYTWYDVPYVYLTDNASKLGYSEKDASILISIIGIINMVGEIILGWAGDRSWANASIIYAICMGLCGGVIALIPLISDYYLLCLISGGFGFLIAANYSLTCVILVELITLDRFTNAYGLLLLVQGFANLIGPPIGGWLYDITGTYHMSFYLAGLFIAISGMMLVIIPMTKRYRRFIRERTSSETSIKETSANEPSDLKNNYSLEAKENHQV